MFGLNGYNFNMNSMMSFMPFGNFGCGSYGTSFLNAGSLFGFNCNGYNTSVGYGYGTGCGMSWKSMLGLSLGSLVLPLVGSLVGRGVSRLTNNSIKKQQETVDNDITTLKAQQKTLQEQYDAKDKVVKDFNNSIDEKKTTLDGYLAKIKTQQDIVDAYYNNNEYILILENHNSINDVPEEEKATYKNAQIAKINAERAKTELAKLEREKTQLDNEIKAEQAKLEKAQEELKEIKDKLDTKKEQIKVATAKLQGLTLDRADGTGTSQTRTNKFQERFNTEGENYSIKDNEIGNVKKGDLQYIIAQYKSSSNKADKQKWGELYISTIENNGLDIELKNNTLLKEAYQIIKNELG